MISRERRDYEYFRYSEEDNAYGQKTLIKDDENNPVVFGTVSMSIFDTANAFTGDVRFKDSKYLGLTNDKFIDTSFVINYKGEHLRVQYIVPRGRYKQVFLNSI